MKRGQLAGIRPGVVRFAVACLISLAAVLFYAPAVHSVEEVAEKDSGFSVPINPVITDDDQAPPEEQRSPDEITITVESIFDDYTDVGLGPMTFIVWCEGLGSTELEIAPQGSEEIVLEVSELDTLSCELSQRLTPEQHIHYDVAAIGDTFDDPDDGRISTTDVASADQTRMYVVNVMRDTDGDGYSDITEKKEQTDPDDPQSYPGSEGEVLGTNTEENHVVIIEETEGEVLGLAETGDLSAFTAILLGITIVTVAFALSSRVPRRINYEPAVIHPEQQDD